MGLLDTVKDTGRYGLREDGTKKSTGFLGKVPNASGKKTMTEYSVSIGIDGKEVLIPTLVPGLTQKEIDFLRTEPKPNEIPDSIYRKAKDHAMKRMKKGLSPFAD